MSSYNGVTLRVLPEGYSDSQDGLVSIRPIPWGDNVVVDVGGTHARTIDCTLLFDSQANMASVRARVGKAAAQLVIDNVGTLTAVLLPGFAAEGGLPGGKVKAKARFLIV
jgi:hypothetical protein